MRAFGLLPFLFVFPSSLSLSLDKTISTVLNRNGESKYSCLVPDSAEMLSSSLLTMLAVDLLYIAFIMLDMLPTSPASQGLCLEG